MTSCSNRTTGSYSQESFLKDRYAAGSFLEKSFTVIPEGTSLAELSKNQGAFDADFPGDAHIRSVVKRQRWISHNHYQFTLNLSEAMLSSHNQASSKTMVAEDLLPMLFLTATENMQNKPNYKNLKLTLLHMAKSYRAFQRCASNAAA